MTDAGTQRPLALSIDLDRGDDTERLHPRSV